RWLCHRLHYYYSGINNPHRSRTRRCCTRYDWVGCLPLLAINVRPAVARASEHYPPATFYANTDVPVAFSASNRVVKSFAYATPAGERKNATCACHTCHRSGRHSTLATVPLSRWNLSTVNQPFRSG